METDTSSKQPNKAIIALIVVALLVVIAAGVLLLGKNESPKTTTSENAPSVANESTPTTSSSTTSQTYKDGTYEASGTYRTPGGNETIDVSLTVAGGVITAATFEGHPTSRDTEDYQGRFAGGYKALVVGKSLDEVSLNRVAGSSLTSGGFNQALEQIKSDAKA